MLQDNKLHTSSLADVLAKFTSTSVARMDLMLLHQVSIVTGHAGACVAFLESPCAVAAGFCHAFGQARAHLCQFLAFVLEHGAVVGVLKMNVKIVAALIVCSAYNCIM